MRPKRVSAKLCPPCSFSPMALRWIVLMLLVGGCTGSRATPEPDAQFGHRYEDRAPDGRHTVATSPAEEGETYRYFPASFESATIRPAPFNPAAAADTQQVAVEVLIKGALPDACMQLHAFEQERTGNIITATLTMRRAQSTVCANAQRPYRFYVMLSGRYGAGHYALRLNGKAVPFEIRVPSL